MTKKTLHDYIMGLKKTHKYTIRILKPELTEQEMSRIENNLQAYELLDITKPKKTIFQSTPYGFTDVTAGEVMIFDVETNIPASSFYLGREIAKILKISEIYVVVNGTDNPPPVLELMPEENENYVSKVSTDPAYPEDKFLPPHEDTYGNKHTEKVLKNILAARAKDPMSIVKTTKN